MIRIALVTVVIAVGCSSPNKSVERCESGGCHGSVGTPNGIELAHREPALKCTDCHGGDGKAKEKELAHVAPAPQFVADRNGYLKNLSVTDLDAVSPDYMRFVNPGDYRVAQIGCGSGSPAAEGGACHQSQVDSAPRSTMSTFVGHFNVPRFQAGLQGRAAIFGSKAVTDLNYPDPPPPGTVPSLVQAQLPGAGADRTTVATLMDNYLPKNCTHCHQQSYGRNDARGNYRSSGCTSCHMLYNDDGISLSSDPSAPREIPPHPERHELTTKIPERQCEACHHQGARIGLLYRGVIEYGFSTPPPFPNIGESLHNHPPEFYLQASSDSAHPADLHYERGMACADCHVGRDVHGDGRIYSTAKFQTSIRCENCHGNVDTEVSAGSAVPPLNVGGTDPECAVQPDGSQYIRNCNGDPLKHIEQRDDGYWLVPAKGGPDLRLSQIKALIEGGRNANMIEAMARDPSSGFSHTEVIECDGCHTAYRQYCFGCHVTMDYSQNKSDLLTGIPTPGAEVTARQDYSLDLYFLGMNRRGKIRSFCPSMQVFLSAVDRDGNGDLITLFQDRTRRNASGGPGFNWATDVPHTTQNIPQNCTRCHADADNACDDTLAREAYGFGTGRYMFTDEDAITYDLTQLLDAAGDPIVEFSHEGQSEVPRAMRDRALAVCVPGQPR